MRKNFDDLQTITLAEFHRSLSVVCDDVTSLTSHKKLDVDHTGMGAFEAA
jgi:hypothetical protein